MSRPPDIVCGVIMRPSVWLLISGVDRRTWSSQLAEGQNLVGRHQACKIRIPDCHVSNFHAIIENCKTTMQITDLNSTNGTYLNGNRIIGAAELQIGDTLQLGPVHIDVVNETAELPRTDDDQDSTPKCSNENEQGIPVTDRKLTPQQCRVVEVVMQGLSDQEIATTLDIEVSTVQSHLKHIYDITGIHGRNKLAARFRGSQKERHA